MMRLVARRWGHMAEIRMRPTTLVVSTHRRHAAPRVRWLSSEADASVTASEEYIVRTGPKPRVVVLGTGWGGFAAAKTLDHNQFDVHVVSPRNHMVFTPLLASSAVGTLEFRGIAEPIRSSFPTIHFHLAKCRGIDPDKKLLTVRTKPERPSNAVLQGTVPTTEYQLEYDALIVAVGARSNTFGIPGVAEHVHFMKELSDARGVRKGITECLEAAAHESISEEERRRLLHFVVVGGGPTGVEFAAELSDFIREDISRYYPELAGDMKVTLVEGREILSSFDANLRKYAADRLKKGAVTIRTGANVQDVSSTEIHLDDGGVLPYGLCVWSTGVGPRKVTAQLAGGIGKTRAQRIATDQHLRVFRDGRATTDARNHLVRTNGVEEADDTYGGLYALGDCAHVLDGNYAPIAQVAERQGLWLAKQLNDMHSRGLSVADGVPTEPFKYKHIASLAYLGRYMALSDFTGSDYEEVKGARLKGWLSWFFWRSAYLSSLGSWRNRLQVPADWTRTLIFGRDINSF